MRQSPLRHQWPDNDPGPPVPQWLNNDPGPPVSKEFYRSVNGAFPPQYAPSTEPPKTDNVKKWIVAAVVVVLLAVGSAVTAVELTGSGSQGKDADYLSRLGGTSLATSAISLAHTICDAIGRGQSESNILAANSSLADSLSDSDVRAIFDAAKAVYCP